MKIYPLCIGCVFILNWFFLALAEDLVPPDNISTEDGEDEEKKETDDLIRNLEPSVDVTGSFNEKIQEDTFSKQLFAEATSQNSGVANDITTSGQPVVVTLTDAATAELQQRAAILPTSQQQQTNNDPSSINNRTENTNFQEHEDETNRTRNNSISSEEEMLKTKENLTEEIPSFSEWAQKQLEQAEKNKEPSNTSAHQHQNVNGGGGGGGKPTNKLRWKNYASLDCGAKVVASNPEAVSPSAILSPSRDEYKLNTCTSRIWFVVELCEAIQAKKIDLANFELFSSSPRDFVVSVSDRFPTREWSNVGQFTAKDERDVQSFDLHPHLFGKYIKVEVKSHYGSEHYCPISLFRVYGTSEFEVLQKEDPVHADRLEEDDDGDDEALDVENGDNSKNLFSSATDAVISMVKKAAEVLGNKGNHSNQTELSNITEVKVTPLVRVCTSPSHLVVCDNCTDVLFGEVYGLLSCSHRQIGDLVRVGVLRDALIASNVCKEFGFEFVKNSVERNSFIRGFFPERYLGAMCNTVAVLFNKVVLNVSSNYANTTTKEVEEIVNIEMSEPHVLEVDNVTDVLEVVSDTATVSKSTCSTDVSYLGQIKPTKTLSSELNLSDTESVGVVESGAKVVETVQVNSTTEELEHQVPEVENLGESVEIGEDPLEHLISELNGEVHQLPNAQTTASTTPQAQKESVFLRLSNRIKALERNMSLSGQYLEELSKRYKKQVEEIQKLLDKTILSISEESKKKEEYNKHLEEKLVILTAAVEALVAERRSWSSTIYCVIVSSLVTLFIVSFCCKIPEPRTLSTSPTSSPKLVEVKRRKSIDVVTHSVPQKRRRRPSDQALKIVRSSTESHDMTQRKKKKKIKHQLVLPRSNSISTLNEGREEAVSSAPASFSVDWVEGKHLEEIPFVLEESEHSSLEPLSTLTTDSVSKLSVPSFLRSAVISRSLRVNGDVVKSRKSVTDESGRKSSSPSINGSVEVAHETPKKEKKGFKKILKKVF